MEPGSLPLPHGDRVAEYPSVDVRRDMTSQEQDVFHAVLHPDDIYDQNGTYWADMPMGQRLKFVNRVNSEESKKEAISIGRMFKNDPLSPFGYYLKNMVLPGAGLGLEGYVLFSIGNVRPHINSSSPRTSSRCDLV